jgi:hypothetical protein
MRNQPQTVLIVIIAILAVGVLLVANSLGMFGATIGSTAVACTQPKFTSTDPFYSNGTFQCTMVATGSGKYLETTLSPADAQALFGITTEKTAKIITAVLKDECKYEFDNQSYPIYQFTLLQNKVTTSNARCVCEDLYATPSTRGTLIGATPIVCSLSNCYCYGSAGSATGCDFSWKKQVGVVYYLDPSVVYDFAMQINMTLDNKTYSAIITQQNTSVMTPGFRAELLGQLQGQQSCPASPNVAAYVVNPSATAGDTTTDCGAGHINCGNHQCATVGTSSSGNHACATGTSLTGVGTTITDCGATHVNCGAISSKSQCVNGGCTVIQFVDKYQAQATVQQGYGIVDAYSGKANIPAATVQLSRMLSSSASTGQYCAITNASTAHAITDTYISCNPTGTVSIPVYNLYINAQEVGIHVPSGIPVIVNTSVIKVEAAQRSVIAVKVRNDGSETDSFDVSVKCSRDLSPFNTRESINAGETKTVNVNYEGAGFIGSCDVTAKSVNSPQNLDTETVKLSIYPFCARQPPPNHEKVNTEFGCAFICPNYQTMNGTDVFDANCAPMTTYDRCTQYDDNACVERNGTKTITNESGNFIVGGECLRTGRACVSSTNYNGFHCTGIGKYTTQNHYMDLVADNVIPAFIPTLQDHKYFITSIDGSPVCQYVNEYGYNNGVALDSLIFDYAPTFSSADEDTTQLPVATCASQPTSCQANYEMSKDGNGCNVCIQSGACLLQPTGCPSGYSLTKGADGCNLCTSTTPPPNTTNCSGSSPSPACPPSGGGDITTIMLAVGVIVVVLAALVMGGIIAIGRRGGRR